MSTKEEIIRLVRKLPDNVALLDILEELSIKHRIEEALGDAAAGRVLVSVLA